MTHKIIKSLVEKGTLTQFAELFNEELNNRIDALKVDAETAVTESFDLVQAEDELDEAADIVGKDKAPKVDDEDEGPSDEVEADDEDEAEEEKVEPKKKKDDKKSDDKELDESAKVHKGQAVKGKSIPGMEGPFKAKSGKEYYYDTAEGLFYDATSDLYVTAKSLGL